MRVGKQKKSYARTAKSGALWSVVRQGGHEVVAVPMSMIMARLLTPREFGVAVAASFFVLLAAKLTQFGFSAAIVRAKEVRREHLSSVFTVGMALGTVSYAALFAASPAIGRFFNSTEAGALVRVAALVFLISPVGSVASALISRKMQFRHAALADWTDTLVGAVVTVALAFAGWSYWSIAVGNVVAVAVRVVLQIYLSGWTPAFGLSRQALRELLSFGLGIQTKRLLEYASSNLDTLVVGRLLDLTALGFYDKAFSTMNRLVNRLTLGQAPFRIFSIIHEDKERFRRAYTRLIVSITLIAYPALLTCIVIAEPLFEVLYGQQWSAAVLPFQVLCIGGMLKLLNAYSSQANEAVGAVWNQAARQAIGTVFVAIGATMGTLLAGIVGAAVGVTVAFAILTIGMQDLVRRATHLSWGALLAPQVPGLMGGVLIATLLGAMEWGLATYRPAWPAWQRLASEVLTGGVVYAAYVLFSPFATVREIVGETITDLLPPRAVRLLARFGVG